MSAPVPDPISLPDRYRVRAHLGAGGMATVWQAYDAMLGRDVAIKALADPYASEPLSRRRFGREVRAAARLARHPNVVTVFDVGEHDGRPYMVMELVRGTSVARRLRSGRPSDGTVRRWLAQAAGALDAAHAAGVVHRDVKPANLVIDRRGRLLVVDFGIARVSAESTLSDAGEVLGTASYLSPEQASGAPATSASDRYALAVVAFELVTGTLPFPGDGVPAQIEGHISAPVPSARARREGLAASVDAVFQRALAKDPARRFASATAFVSALEAALVDVSLPEEGHGAPERARSVEERRRHPARRVLATAAAVVLAAAAAFGVSQLQRPVSSEAGGPAPVTVSGARHHHHHVRHRRRHAHGHDHHDGVTSLPPAGGAEGRTASPSPPGPATTHAPQTIPPPRPSSPEHRTPPARPRGVAIPTPRTRTGPTPALPKTTTTAPAPGGATSSPGAPGGGGSSAPTTPPASTTGSGTSSTGGRAGASSGRVETGASGGGSSR
jgi:serine/threonine-protein kinase